MEFKVDKPVDLNANSEEKYLKDISITVDNTNVIKSIENIENNEVVQIKHGKFCYISTVPREDLTTAVLKFPEVTEITSSSYFNLIKYFGKKVKNILLNYFQKN